MTNLNVLSKVRIVSPKPRRSSAQAVARAGVLLSGDAANSALELYFSGRFTGAWFDAVGRGTDPATGAPVDREPNRVTIEDSLSLSLLDTPLKPREVIGLLEINRDLVHLLGRIDLGLTLIAAAPAEDFTESPWASASMAYKLLRASSGIGRSRASKLLARKRPHLIPVWDRYVAEGLAMKGSDQDWVIMQDVVVAHSDRLHAIADEFRFSNRDNGRAQGLSLLRMFDIIGWMRMHGCDLIDDGVAVKVAARLLAKAG